MINMIINYKTQTLIIGYFKNDKINQILVEKGFNIIENNLYLNYPNYEIMKKIVIFLKNKNLTPKIYDYYINIGDEVVRLKYENNKFFKNGNVLNSEIYNFLIKYKKHFQKYKINKPKKFLFQVIGGARTIFQTYQEMYQNLFSQLCVNYDINFYLKEKDTGPKNNSGVNFIYHDLERNDIIDLIQKYNYKGEVNINFAEKDLVEQDKERILNFK